MKLEKSLSDVLSDLGLVIEAIGPKYHDQVLLTGGLVPLFYRYLPKFNKIEEDALLTKDIDFVVKIPLPVAQVPIHDLLQTAGFVAIFSRGNIPPVIKYQHKRYGTELLAPTHLEILTPRHGGPTSRSGKSRNVVKVQANLNAVALPYLNILFEKPISLDASKLPFLKVSQSVNIKIPHPLPFIIQKTLARKRRSASKRDNDQAHIYDVVRLTSPNWSSFLKVISELEVKYKDYLDKSKNKLMDLYNDDTSEGPVVVSNIYNSIPSNSSLTEAQVYQTMQYFFKALEWN